MSALFQGSHDAPMFEAIAEVEVTVDITDGFPPAIKIDAGDLRDTDRLFDTTGGTHALKSVKHRRGWVDTVREDGWPDRFHQSDTITIRRDQEV